MNKKNNNKGFTLAELLIVVAIIAVLVAIAIPVFTSQLEKSREATDLANIRSAYAEITVKAIENPGTDGSVVSVKLRQAVDGWQTSGAESNMKQVFGSGNLSSFSKAGKGGKAQLQWNKASGSDDGYVTLKIS